MKFVTESSFWMIHRVVFCTILLTFLLCDFAGAQMDDYWQQEVNYRMDVTLDGDLRTINGKIEIEYINNSPDTLEVVYLKAWPNAIQKDSYADRKQREQNDYSFADLKREQEGELFLFELGENDEFSERISAHDFFEYDNTIITVYLFEPLPPGYAADLVFGFTTILPDPAAMRMGPVGRTTRAAYWYPQVCVYDRVLGWCNSQYLGWGETYGDYGRFEVNITAPEELIVAATGVCVNEDEVLPPDVRAALDRKNFTGPRSEWPTLQSNSDSTKTWQYVAENVNDFVFSASPDWCIDSDTINGVEVVAYPLKWHARGWTDAVTYGKQSIETFSDLYIPYQWPVIRICDAYSGMEYPMLTNCGGDGNSPYFPLLLYHEIGHQWFMGHVGSNQTDRPFLDEGFTTHAEHVIMEKYVGREGNLTNYDNFYGRMFGPELTDRNVRGFRPLLLLMTQDYDKPMVFSYDRGKEYFPWRVSAYYKTAAMLYSFQSILGDSAYFDAMRYYCDRWLFKHPYEDDFRDAMEDATGLELDEYLRQWYYSRYLLDYGFAGQGTRDTVGGLIHTIKLTRVEPFVAPVDVGIVWEQGDTTFFTIPPEGMEYAKRGFRLLPTWKQFRMPNNTYEFEVNSMRRIKKVVVDPHHLLMDVDRTNNESPILNIWPVKIPSLNTIDLRFDNLIYDKIPVWQYRLRWRPDVWYDDANGVQIGFHSHGSYLDRTWRHWLDVRYGVKSAKPTIDFSFASPLNETRSKADFVQRFLLADFRFYTQTSYLREFKPLYSRPDRTWLQVDVSHLDFTKGERGSRSRFDPVDPDLRKYFSGQPWDITGTTYLTVVTGWLRTFRYGSITFWSGNQVGTFKEAGKREGFMEADLRGTLTLTRDEDQPWLNLRAEYFNSHGEPPSQFLHHLSRTPAVTRFTESPIFRSPGTFPTDWEDDFYLTDQRVRGYQDRVLYITDAVGGSIELTPPDLMPYSWMEVVPVIGGWLGGIDQSLFFDASAVSMDGKESAYPAPISENETVTYDGDKKWFMSAGLSLQFPSVVRGRRLRLDFPLYLSKPVAGEDEFAFRFSAAWLLPFEF